MAEFGTKITLWCSFKLCFSFFFLKPVDGGHHFKTSTEAPSGARCRNRGAEGRTGPGHRLAWSCCRRSRPVPSWRWSARAPAPPAARSGLPCPRLLLVRRSRRRCERGRDRRNLTLKYLRSECLWILEHNWEFIWNAATVLKFYYKLISIVASFFVE